MMSIGGRGKVQFQSEVPYDVPAPDIPYRSLSGIYRVPVFDLGHPAECNVRRHQDVEDWGLHQTAAH